ncbi:hypothetical protein V2J09_005683 [Rumex salicifolius]
MESSHTTGPPPPPAYTCHVVAVPYPSQGHINPMLQFCKRVCATRPTVKATFAVTSYIASTYPSTTSHPSVTVAAISDGFDSGGFSDAATVDSYLEAVASAGRKSLSDLLRRLAAVSTPATCVVYDAFSPWALDVAVEHGLPAAAFFTQPCAVNYIYYLMHKGVWAADEVARSGPVTVPGTEVEMGMEDLPSFVGVPGSYPAYFRLVLNQYSNIDKADCILVNTFYELEPQVVDSMSKHIPLLTIGPTIPSFFLDQEDPNDRDYGLHLFSFKDSTTNAAVEWLNTKPPRSTVYVSFGSLSDFTEQQLEEVVWALTDSDHDFLWAIRATEQPKLPKGILEEMSAQGRCMLVAWCTQIQVLVNDAVGCFLTHCGWNSTQEALSLGVPMVAIPQWTDQPSNAKLMQDLWKVGLKTKAGENGIVSRDEIGRCLREVISGDKSQEMRVNAQKWREFAKKAFTPAGLSDCNIDVFLSKCA